MSLIEILKGFEFNQLQEKTLFVLAIIMLSSVLYCFVVGEISRNNSQMDKLWSILPIAYTWVVAGMSGMNWRCVVIAILVSFWGIRLTINFARKGAYSIKFWSGEEDYRWKYLRSKKPFNNKIIWCVFDLLFISFFQNLIVLLITLPSVALMSSNSPLCVTDFIGIILSAAAIVYELIADEQQMEFQTKKWDMINDGQKLEDLPMPYRLGFNTTGLWNYSRHPNYIGEQLTWVGIYVFSIGTVALLNWSIIGMILLILIFVGSSRLAENISSSKYPLYKEYQKSVFKYLPVKKYRK